MTVICSFSYKTPAFQQCCHETFKAHFSGSHKLSDWGKKEEKGTKQVSLGVLETGSDQSLRQAVWAALPLWEGTLHHLPEAFLPRHRSWWSICHPERRTAGGESKGRCVTVTSQVRYEHFATQGQTTKVLAYYTNSKFHLNRIPHTESYLPSLGSISTYQLQVVI